MRNIIPRDLIKHLEWTPGTQPLPPQNPLPGNPGVNPINFRVQSSPDYWTISGVKYRNEIRTVDLAKSLLEDGATKNQDQWAAYSEGARENNEFYTPDYPLLYNTIKALSEAGTDASSLEEVIKAKKFLKDTSRANWLMTLTRIQYKEDEDDVVIHNFGMKDKLAYSVNFVGPDEKITDTGFPHAYEVLLETSDPVGNINDVFKWLNGTDAYLYRVNAEQTTDKVAGFVANSGRAFLSCYVDPSVSDSSLGVHLSREKI